MSVYFIVEMSSYYNGVWIDTEEGAVLMTREEIAQALSDKWKVDPEREDPNEFYQVWNNYELRFTVTHKVEVVADLDRECPCGDHYCRFCGDCGDCVEPEEGVGPNGFYDETPNYNDYDDDCPF